MLSSSSLPSMRYCGDAVRKESLTEYAYFIFCNCLPSPTDQRQKGSVKLLKKRFPELYKRISYDISACLTKNCLLYGSNHRQEFSMSDLETALKQYCSRNGYEDLPYTAAANSIAAQFKRMSDVRGVNSGVMETALMSKSEDGFISAQESVNDIPQIPDTITIPDNNSQTDSFTYTDTSLGSGDRFEAREKFTSKSLPHPVPTYDADQSSDNEAQTSSTLQDSLKRHFEMKRHNSVKKQTVTPPIPQVLGPDCHGPDRIFKIVMLGNSGVGKSSIVSALVLGNARYALATIGVDMVVKTFMVQGVKVSLQIWDTAGEERFHCMAPSYIRKADAVVLVYDISDHTSFVDVPIYWLPFIRRHLTGDNVSLLLLGNKMDKSVQRVITGEDGSVLSRDGGMVFREVSSRDSDTICGVYHSLAQTLVANENAELDRFSQLTTRRTEVSFHESPRHGNSCLCL